MTENEGGTGRDMSRTWEGRRAAAARRRVTKAAEVLATASEEWPAHARAVLTDAGIRALETIDRVDPNAR